MSQPLSPRRHLCVKPVLLGRREDPGSRPHGDIWLLPRGRRICQSWTGRVPYLRLKSRGMPSVAGGRPQSWVRGPAGSSRWPQTRSGVARVGAGGEGVSGRGPVHASRLSSPETRAWAGRASVPMWPAGGAGATRKLAHSPRAHTPHTHTHALTRPGPGQNQHGLKGGRGPPPGG